MTQVIHGLTRDELVKRVYGGKQKVTSERLRMDNAWMYRPALQKYIGLGLNFERAYRMVRLICEHEALRPEFGCERKLRLRGE